MQIPQNVIDEVNDRADIVEVIGKFLKLKRSGANYFACCPFHNEKSASFSVSPVKQIYHCFGCGETGNSITFTMKHLGLDFVSAVKSLAEQYGVQLPTDDKNTKLTPAQREEYKERKLNIQQTMQHAVKFYQQRLSLTADASNYLIRRGLSPQIINQFELGFAPVGYNNLANIFKDYAKNKLLLDTGLVSENSEGKRYDRFRDRIIFPIKNVKGEIIGFGGRIIDKGEPKYLNSPETELFNKSKELYGLFDAKKSIRELNLVYVVEGYMDVIALNQYGIHNVVATMGTAATEEHIKTLFRLCDNICYSFDGDNAGKKAAWRALERSIPLVTDIKVVRFLFLPSEHDPDSYIREFGVDAFLQIAKNGSFGLITFLLNQLATDVNLQSDEGRARLISLVKPYLEQLKAIALVVMLKKQLANLIDLEPSVVESILNNRSRFAFFNKKIKQLNDTYQSQGQRTTLNVNLLALIVLALFDNPKLAREFPTPELEILQQLDSDIDEFFKLISFLELNYDEFEDIIITDLLKVTNFQHVNLQVLYDKVRVEKQNYTTTFKIDVLGYQKKLHELVYEKKRPRMPKLD